MLGQPARTIGRALAAVALTGVAVLAAAAPSLAATGAAARPAASQAAAARAKGWWAAGYTGKQVHGTWAGPGVGLIAWTVGLSMDTYKGNAYRSCRSNWTGVNIDVSWNSESLHNGAQLVIMDSVKLSNGKWQDVGPALDDLEGGPVAGSSGVRRPVPRLGVHARQRARRPRSHRELDQQRRRALPGPDRLR